MAEEPLKFFATATGGEWKPVEDSEEEDEVTPGCGQALKRILVELLRADNLVVLTGLGSSLCVNSDDGDRLLPTMNDLWDAAEAMVGEEKFANLLTAVKYPKPVKRPGSKAQPEVKKDIELLLSQCHVALAFTQSDEIEEFIRDTENLIVEKCNVLGDEVDLEPHEAFLRRIARRSTRLPRSKVFTTNYDLCFETAASRINFVAVDGFSHTMPQEFDASHFSFDFVRRHDDAPAPEFIPNVFHLYKLHGSVDWDKSSGRIRRNLEPSEPVLVFPRHSKFETSYEHPFFEVMARFMAALRQPKTTLLIIGFGFADKHITNPILAAIRSNVGLRVLVVDPILESKPSAAVQTMASLIEKGDQRLGLLAARFQDFVQLLPDIVAETEQERHGARLREATE